MLPSGANGDLSVKGTDIEISYRSNETSTDHNISILSGFLQSESNISTKALQ